MPDRLDEIKRILQRDDSGETLNKLRREILEDNKIRKPKFHKINKRSFSDAVIPKRATLHSAGYDFKAVENYTLPPQALTYVGTGIKAEMPYDMVLLLFIRSSMSRNLTLRNSVGVVDADYFENPNNDGHIMGMVYNETNETIVINKHQRFMQGVFVKYHTVENDSVVEEERSGGFGSTG